MIDTLEATIAFFKRSLIVPPLGEQSGQYQRIDRDGQQRRTCSIGAVRQARELNHVSRAEGCCPDYGTTKNKCGGRRKHRPAMRGKQGWQEQTERKQRVPPIVRPRSDGSSAHCAEDCKRQRAFRQLPSSWQVTP